MPTLLDLTAIEAASYPVLDRAGKTWHLRDVIPAEVLLRGFGLLELDERIWYLQLDAQTPYTPDLALSDPPTTEEILAVSEARRQHSTAQRIALQEAYSERVALVTALALACFQASYPDMDELRLTALVPTERERRAVVSYFFGLLLFGSNAGSSASSASDDATASAVNASPVPEQEDLPPPTSPPTSPPTGPTTPRMMTRTPATTSRSPAAPASAAASAAASAPVASRTASARKASPASSSSRRPTSTPPIATGRRPPPTQPAPQPAPQPMALRAVPKPSAAAAR